MTVFRGYGPGDARGTAFNDDVPLFRKRSPSLEDPPKVMRVALENLTDDEFVDIASKVKAELDRRAKPIRQELYAGLSNFMTGVAHAMACRAALRWVRGLKPFYTPGRITGIKATSGEMWTAREGAELHARVNTMAQPERAKYPATVDKDCPPRCNWDPLVMEAVYVVNTLCHKQLFSKF